MKKLYYTLLLLLAAVGMHAQDRMTGRDFATRSEVIAQNGMAATSHPLATQIALDVLKKGGSAVDAAIAANAALGLMEPTGSGIGGDLFAIVWDPSTQSLHGLNGSGRSPKGMSLDFLVKEKGLTRIPAYGPLPVTIPGCVDGWFELHKRFGTLPMADVLSPAIGYAENGFPITELIAYYWGRSAKAFQKQPNFADTYMPAGKAPEKGHIFKNPYLANTYRKLAQGGRDAFYKGEVAQTMVDFLRSQGGQHSIDDFAAHTSEWVKPVSTNYRGYDVWELPPNGQGITTLQMLNILEAYPFSEWGFGSPEHIHYFTEAKKLAFEDRAKYYADMNFAKVPVETLISKEYAAERRALIQPDRAGKYDAGKISQGETIYLTVADKNGMMVSLIQSNYRGMGSGMVAPKLGFMFQDRGELFSLTPGDANVYEPGKRPFHTIIPAFVTKDGQPFLSFGVMGGDFQPLGHVQVLMNIIDFGMNIQEAGDAPRIHHEGASQPTGETDSGKGEIVLESGFPYETIRALMNMGHKVGYSLGIYGGYQAIMYDPQRKLYYGASESRKDGQAAGY